MIASDVKYLLLLVVLIMPIQVMAQTSFKPLSDAQNAQTAYNDLIDQFWTGDIDTGHFVRLSREFAVGDEVPAKGWLWEYSVGVGALYAHWKANKSPDALRRLRAEWRWIRSLWSLADVSKCGVGTTNTAQDDTSWDLGATFQLWEATHDKVALKYTKAMLDCAWDRWHDSQIGGGLWYSDAHSEKGSYQASYAYMSLQYSLAVSDPTYTKRAIDLAAWAASLLRRPDGIYWANISPNGTPQGSSRPNDIHISSSVSFLAGNMAWAALDAQLYYVTKNITFKERLVSTAAAIRLRQTFDGNVFIDDRDAWTNGWAAWYYAKDVIPLLPSHGSADSSTYRSTAQLIMRNDRSVFGTYGGDWQGPLRGTWFKKGSTDQQLRTSATAVVWPIVAASLARASR